MERAGPPAEHVAKFGIKLKSRPKDGVILQLHHTVREAGGASRRIRFTGGAWAAGGARLACADSAGNLFVLDLRELSFWRLAGVGACSALLFLPDALVAACATTCAVRLVDAASGRVRRALAGHSAPARHLAAAGATLLSASPREAILWELPSCTKYFTLDTFPGAHIQQMLFSPGGALLVACFQNDTVQLWKRETMQSVKQIVPSELKRLRSVAFTTNGRAMAIAGLSPALILFSMDTWKAIRSVDLTRYDLSGALQVAFVPQEFDGGANKVLAVLGSDRALYLLDLETLRVAHAVSPEPAGIRRLAVGPAGQYLACVLQQGQVNIYNCSQLLELGRARASEAAAGASSERCRLQDKSKSKAAIEQKMRVCMDGARLRRILMQYGEYPEKFRAVIWRALLATPRNKGAHAALVAAGVHPAFGHIERQFTIHSGATLKNLKRLLSCLAHWCPLFAVLKFLPGFVFPFVKVLQRDPLLLFESVATVLVNQCQLWFEYAPFPPLSVLAMVENVLAERERALLDHFVSLGATSQLYALPVLETAFSEVLSGADWLVLWDHVLSNEPAFLLMAAVAYSAVNKTAIRKIKSHDRLEKFFHMQNPIDKKAFLKKTYALLDDTPEDVHPRKFFQPFASLERGECYRQFTGYPKATICLKLAKQNRKKALKSERYTLRELATRSQERQLSERVLKTDDLTDACSACSEAGSARGHEARDQGDHWRPSARDSLLHCVMFPGGARTPPLPARTPPHPARTPPHPARTPPHPARTPAPHASSRNKEDVLEKEVEKLISPCLESDSD